MVKIIIHNYITEPRIMFVKDMQSARDIKSRNQFKGCKVEIVA